MCSWRQFGRSCRRGRQFNISRQRGHWWCSGQNHQRDLSVRFPKRYIYHFLFALCVGVPYLNNYELTFVVWLLALTATIQQRYSLTILKQVAFFTGIFAIGIAVTFFKDYKMYYIIRDITYMLKPI